MGYYQTKVVPGRGPSSDFSVKCGNEIKEKRVLKPFSWRHEHVQRCLSDRGQSELIPDPSSKGMVWKSEDLIAIYKVTAGLNVSDFCLGIDTEALAKFAGFYAF